jgi:glycosyltransferase involved in cell wall biosynthesis
MPEKHILYLITRAEAGGAQSHVLELITGLRERFRVSLASGEQDFLMHAARDLGIDHHFLPALQRKLSPRRDIAAYCQIRDLLRNLKPDLLHCHSSKAGILGRLAAHRLGIKSVFTAHGWAFAEGTPTSRKLLAVTPEWMAARWCDRIITVSEADRALANRYHVANSDKLTVIHNGISDIDTELISKPCNGTPRLIMVARFAPPKQQAILLQVVAGIDEDLQLILVGDGPQLAEAQHLAKQLGISDRVEFTGRCSTVAQQLSRADLFILLSDWEGFPISVLEAMRAGLPVIASNVGGIREAVSDNLNGRLLSDNDESTVRSTLIELLRDPQKRIDMGKRSREAYLGNFTASAMLDRTASLYDEILEG